MSVLNIQIGVILIQLLFVKNIKKILYVEDKKYFYSIGFQKGIAKADMRALTILTLQTGGHIL